MASYEAKVMESSEVPLPQGQPAYFHLLWDHELEDLSGVLRIIAERKEEVFRRWYSLYVVHFGDARALTEAEFQEIFGTELQVSVRTLLQHDVAGFVENVRRQGDQLARRKVPFSEVVVSTHLFEESATAVFPALLTPKVYLAFDKLSHIRIILLADSYFRSVSAVADARIRDLEEEASRLPVEERSRFHGLIGASPAMRQLYERIQAAAMTRGTILIVGESGSGKELVARAIHEAGPHPLVPFVPFNCAAIPRDLIESELFGYKRGAFSGATVEYLGLFRAADGGTLFLDEITEMSPQTQTKLLRALQERTVRPVGSTQEVPVDVRLIASTNRDPEEALKAGQLRDDLYYRLQASVLHVPPLRERLSDVPLLVEHFINLFNQKIGRRTPVVGIEPLALAAMERYSWPGNVRELSNSIESAFTFGRSQLIQLEDLPPAIHHRSSAPAPSHTETLGTFADIERDVIRRSLEATGGNKVQAAKLLRVSRKKLYAKIRKYGLSQG